MGHWNIANSLDRMMVKGLKGTEHIVFNCKSTKSAAEFHQTSWKGIVNEQNFTKKQTNQAEIQEYQNLIAHFSGEYDEEEVAKAKKGKSRFEIDAQEMKEHNDQARLKEL